MNFLFAYYFFLQLTTYFPTISVQPDATASQESSPDPAAVIKALSDEDKQFFSSTVKTQDKVHSFVRSQLNDCLKELFPESKKTIFV